MEYQVGVWPEEKQVEPVWRPMPEPAQRMGNHRVRIRFTGVDVAAARARIVWRRRDKRPETRAVILTTAGGNRRIRNLIGVNITREFGDFVFQPQPGETEYLLYFMPFEITGLWAFPTIVYRAPEASADPAWLEAIGLAPGAPDAARLGGLPEAEVVAFEARSEFDRFTDMEIIALEPEVSALVRQAGDARYLLFPEDRRHPIRMTGDIPERWAKKGVSQVFRGMAERGEFFAFQVGVYAIRGGLEAVGFEFSDMKHASAPDMAIRSSRCRCFSLGGNDWLGRAFSRAVAIAEGKVHAFWFGIDVPADVEPGEYAGSLILRFSNAPAAVMRVELDVCGKIRADHGDGELWRHSRLRWLDSGIGLEDEPVAPYSPVSIDGATVSCLGRAVTFGPDGFPRGIRSFFPPNADRLLGGEGRELLAAPVRMVAECGGGPVQWHCGGVSFSECTAGSARLDARSAAGALTMDVSARMEFDGYINYKVSLAANEPVDFGDIRLEIAWRRAAAVYMMGLGRKGGKRPTRWDWKWDERFANNQFWLGDVTAGLYCKLKGEEDAWNLGDLKSCGIPDSWGNGGRGGCAIEEEADCVRARIFSGPRRIMPGRPLEFRFGLLPTPVKTLCADHWDRRYCHDYRRCEAPETVAELGAGVINIHQGNELNQYINYPFLAVDKLKNYVAEAHRHKLKVNIYYTIRELSNHVHEMWALRSLGGEVFLDGPGFRLAAQCFPEDVDRRANGWAWLQEHLEDRFVPAWHEPLPDGDWDAAIATTGLSRWHNYYLEGLAWLIREAGIDGLYLDGIGYDREVMKRVRRAMGSVKPGCLVDFHSGNNFSEEYGLNNPACLYMEHFPYIDNLWFGEGFDPNEPPDYWLVEMSGIPFGLFGEMLHGGGNPWRGMLYGMTNRLHWCGDPRPIWRLWDAFGILEARMIGYWDADCPVRTNRESVFATVYSKPGRALVALASWEKQPVDCRLSIDFESLGLDAKDVRMYAPAVEGLQAEESMTLGGTFNVAPGGGRFIILDRRGGRLRPGGARV